MPTEVKVKGRGCKPAVCCMYLLSICRAGARTQGTLRAHSATELQSQHPVAEEPCLWGLCASDSCIRRIVVGLEEVLPKQESSTNLKGPCALRDHHFLPPAGTALRCQRSG